MLEELQELEEDEGAPSLSKWVPVEPRFSDFFGAGCRPIEHPRDDLNPTGDVPTAHTEAELAAHLKLEARRS